jgi:hypothetical protein
MAMAQTLIELHSAPNQCVIMRALAPVEGGPLCLTLDLLTELTALDRHQLTAAVSGLVSRGWVERRERGCYQATVAGVAAVAAGEQPRSGPQGQAPRRGPKRKTLRQRCWNAMRITRKFTAPDLVALARRDSDADPNVNIQKYLLALRKAGIIAPLPKRLKDDRRGSNGLVVYLLLINNGPLAPMVLSDGSGVRDPNTNITLPFEGVGP